MGLQEPAGGKYFKKCDYDGWYKTDTYNRLRLVCPQLAEDDCLFDGRKSKILATLPLKKATWQICPPS